MRLQDVRNAVVSRIESLPDNQIVAVWNYLEELAKAESRRADLLNQYMTFWCDKQLLGVAIDQVAEVISIVEITPLPDFPPYMKGIISLRNKIIPVMDLRMRLGIEETSYNSHTCIIIINIQGRSFGLIVDEVNAVERIPEHDISPVPNQTNSDMRYLTGIAKREQVILILSIDHLLNEKEFSTILNLSDDVDEMR
mgnify:CR=1 FL=1